MENYLCIDIGTSSAKIAIVDVEGHVLISNNQSYPTYYPNPGWSEQNPEDWWAAVVNGIKYCLEEKQISGQDIKCVGIAGQSWSNVSIDKDGNTFSNTPIWTDTRAKEICERYIEKIGEEAIFKVSGNPFMPGYQLPKILWLMENEPENYQKTDKFLSSNGFIGYKLTGKIKMDDSQAYGLHNINMQTLEMDEFLTEEFGIDADKIPEICSPTSIIGEILEEAASQTGLVAGTPVIAGGLDAACSTLGVGVYEDGMVQEQGGQAGGMSIALKEMITHPALIMSRHVVPGLFLLQGGTVAGGASYEWLVKLLKPEESVCEINKKDFFIHLDQLAENVNEGSDGLIFLPYLSGERSPIWDPSAKGVFYGLDFGKGKGHLTRAVMEGVAYSLQHNLETAQEIGIDIHQFRATGGSANSKLWTQIKADVTGCHIDVPESDDATVKGVAMLCGMALGSYQNIGDFIRETIKIKKSYEPQKNNEKYDRNFKKYKEIYQSLKHIMQD